MKTGVVSVLFSCIAAACGSGGGASGADTADAAPGQMTDSDGNGGTGPDADVDADADADTDADGDTDADTDTDSDTDADTEVDTDADVDADTDADTDGDTDTDTDTDGDTDTDTDGDTNTAVPEDTETGSPTDIGFDTGGESDPDTDTEPAETLIVDAAVTYQTMEGFGASDAWNVDFVGTYWTDDEKEGIARLLFSQDPDADGNPEGIGLSRWRFNVGGGSAEQGAASGIEEDTRRAECFLNPDGTYDWTKQAGQRWFLGKAVDYGVEKRIMFSNSPPVYYTRNGKAYGDDGINTNLASDHFDDFAAFLAAVVAHFEEEGIPVDEVSPVNEPQWDWTGGQEGSTWTNAEIAHVVDALDTALTAAGLSTDIMVPESGHYDDLHENTGNGDKGDYMWNLFDPERSTYIGDHPRVPAAICGHTYWTFDTDAQLVDVRTAVREEADGFDLEVFQTEYSMLSIPEELGADPGYYDIALFMAKVIYADLAIANTVSWAFWTSLDRDRWGHKNRYYLIRLIPPRASDGPLDESGTHQPAKTLWVLGNYSLFVRPGYRRIALEGADDLKGLMGTAYQAPDSADIVSVFVNMARQGRRVALRFDNLPAGKRAGETVVYVTSESADLEKAATLRGGGRFTIPPRSVVTMRTTLTN